MMCFTSEKVGVPRCGFAHCRPSLGVANDVYVRAVNGTSATVHPCQASASWWLMDHGLVAVLIAVLGVSGSCSCGCGLCGGHRQHTAAVASVVIVALAFVVVVATPCVLVLVLSDLGTSGRGYHCGRVWPRDSGCGRGCGAGWTASRH